MLLSRALGSTASLRKTLTCLAGVHLTRSTMSMSNLTPTSSTSPSTSSDPTAQTKEWPRRTFTPKHTTWPYTPRDFARQDPTPDDDFYAMPRLVTHIDDHAIAVLGEYYDAALPRKGKVLDLCSSWISHFPPSLMALATPSDSSGGAQNTPLEVIGMGMNQAELLRNPILSRRILQDLNQDPALPSDPSLDGLDSVTCVVSIDYLIHPLATLESCLDHMKPGGRIHLVISNRCFPTKAIRRWLEVSEEERLEMVGDYLHFAGFRDIEIVTLSQGKQGYWSAVDPLWVVTGIKPAPA